MLPQPQAKTSSTYPPDMVVCYNGDFMPLIELPLCPINRSFLYGDSIFETIVLRKGKVRCLPLHLKRIKKGVSVLQLQWSEDITVSYLEGLFLELAERNKMTGDVRFRWQVWRGDGGKFIPDSHDAHHIITAEELPPFVLKMKKAIVSDDVKVSVSSFSSFKTGNCLPYILAGLEAKEKQVDDVILLGGRYELAETISSNIFWFRNNKLYTPSLHSGCVDGIMRKRIIEWCAEKGVEVVRARSSVRHLLMAETAFTSNVAGIHYLATVNDQQIPAPHPMVEEMIEDLILLKNEDNC